MIGMKYLHPKISGFFLSLWSWCLITMTHEGGPACEHGREGPRAPRQLRLSSLSAGVAPERQAICTATQRKHTCRARVSSAFYRRPTAADSRRRALSFGV